MASIELLEVGPALSRVALHDLEPATDAAVHLVEVVDDHRLEGLGQPGAAELVRAVVREHDVRQVHLERPREALELRAPLVDELGGDDQVPDEATLVGVLGPALDRHLARLADVVQEGPGDHQLAVGLRVLVGDPLGKAHHRGGVVGEPAGVRVVDALGGRRTLEVGGKGLIVQERAQERLQVRILEPVDHLAYLLEGALTGGGLGRRRELGEVEALGRGLLDRIDLELNAPLEGRHRSVDQHQVALGELGVPLFGLLPDTGVEIAGAVAQRYGQEGLSGLGAGRGLLRDHEDALHLLFVVDVLDVNLLHGASSSNAGPSAGATIAPSLWACTDSMSTLCALSTARGSVPPGEAVLMVEGERAGGVEVTGWA